MANGEKKTKEKLKLVEDKCKASTTKYVELSEEENDGLYLECEIDENMVHIGTELIWHGCIIKVKKDKIKDGDE